jgi:hypothetical protein
MHIIVIPVFDDWKSLNKLLLKIDAVLNAKELVKILIINDCSKKKPYLNLKKPNNIKEIKILELTKNLGSQKAITVALNYLKKIKSSFYVTIMDSDGEDNPEHIKNMIYLAKKNKDSVIVSCRKDREENLVIKICYKIHLILTFFLTARWISFGNFSSFHSKNLKKILSDNSAWLAYSAAVMKNVNIKKTYSTRLKRFYGKSKVSVLFLIKHSIKIIGVFYKRVLFFSLFYLLLANELFKSYDSLFLIFIFTINIVIILNIYKKNKDKEINFIKNIKKISYD